MRSRHRLLAAVVALLVTAGPDLPADADGVPDGAAEDRQTEPLETEPRRNFDHLIGHQYAGDRTPLPRWVDLGGSLLVDRADLWLGVYETPTRRYVFVTNRFVRTRVDGIPIWRILDTATTIDPVRRNGYWANPCRRDGHEIPRSVGVAAGPDPHFNRAVQLWTWSTPDGRLRPSRIANVFCWTGNPD